MRDVSLHLMDIVQNSVKAGADKIIVNIFVEDGFLHFTIEDNGCGMDKEMVQKVFDPFTTTRTTRKVGLGIPLLDESCKMAEGEVTIKSTPLVGTFLSASFLICHIDRLPLGDVGITMATLMSSREDINYILKFSADNKSFEVSTKQIKETLGGEISLSNPDVVNFITEFINENIKNIFGGILDEIIS